MFKLSAQPLEKLDLKGLLSNPGAGACVSFEGWVRNRNEGRAIASMEYEAYAPLAEKEGNRILAEAMDKYAILEARCLHRIGRLEVGEIAVWVGVAAVHRKDAFKAGKYIIDAVKCRLPIWKKEFYEGGDTGWVRPAGEKSSPL